MSQNNVEIVVRQFERFNARDFDAIVAAWTKDVTLVAHGSWEFASGGAQVVGREALAKRFAEYFGHFERDYRVEIDEIHDLGDRVLIVATDHARGRTSGAPIAAQVTYLYTLREQHVCAIELWDDRRAALDAVGLSD